MNQIGKYDTPIYGIICFTSQNAKIKNDNPKFKALTVSELNDYILTKSQEELLSQEDQMDIMQHFLDVNKNSETYSQLKQREPQKNTIRKKSIFSKWGIGAMAFVALLLFFSLFVNDILNQTANVLSSNTDSHSQQEDRNDKNTTDKNPTEQTNIAVNEKNRTKRNQK